MLNRTCLHKVSMDRDTAKEHLNCANGVVASAQGVPEGHGEVGGRALSQGDPDFWPAATPALTSSRATLRQATPTDKTRKTVIGLHPTPIGHHRAGLHARVRRCEALDRRRNSWRGPSHPSFSNWRRGSARTTSPTKCSEGSCYNRNRCHCNPHLNLLFSVLKYEHFV